MQVRSPFLLLMSALAAPTFAADYQLKATPSTVAWGYYWSQAKPVLRIKSGDRVEVQTMLTNSPDRLASAGVKPEEIESELKAIYAEIKDKGPGGHILTGPIFIEGAEPGDTLEVRIQKIAYQIPYAYNSFGPRSGVLAGDDFAKGAMKIIPFDFKRGIARFSDNIEIPLRPFFGSMGVAPPESAGRVNSAPPGLHAGNLDNKDLVAGTTLFIPVHVPGALFEVGDGHAGQGNGEVDITALETSLTGTFQFVVRKDLKLKAPRGETPTHWIAMGLNPDLTEALKMAVRECIDFLVTEKHLSREDAYMLSSVGVDFNVTQAVDGTKGVHAMIPKSIFTTATGKSDFITMERTVCFGSCPSYKVTIAQDGLVTFEGRQFVKTKGTTTARINPEDFKKLVNEFEKIKYFSLDDRYEPGSPGCPNAATDSPSARTSIRMNGRSKSVSHYYGCRDSEVLRALTTLERKVDEIAGTEKWIR
jgi:acetamidase/formamidase